ncbi:putative glycosyl transferase [Thermostichus vulcanus NIES-2134]|nr:putative glycosyl transferase [Thermostichus vulcanus NIES-2134]
MISVVIPLFNKAPHIVRAVESVLAQSSPADEIIVVDDGSTDGGGELLLPYVAKHGVQLIRQENAGLSVTRNRGVHVAASDYVAFLDADDFWLPNHIATLRRLIFKYPEASLLSTAHIIERDSRQYRSKNSYADGWEGVVQDFLGEYAAGPALVNSTTACVKKEDFLSVGGFPVGVRRGEDIICWIKMALRFPAAHAEVVTAVYYQDAVNRTDKLRETEPPGSLQFIAELLQGNEITDAQRVRLAWLFDRIAFYTAAGFRANGDVRGVDAIRKLAWEIGQYRTALETTALRFVPGPLLRAAKKFRHPRANESGRH